MFQQFKLMIICITSVIFLSCSITPKLTKEEKALVGTRPSPYTRTSPYHTALFKFGQLLTAYGISSELIVQGKEIDNKTACEKLPLDITDMIKTAFNNIGGNVRYAMFHPEYILLETKTGSSTIGRKLPELVVDGAITECDEDLDTKGRNVQATLQFGGGDWETEVEAGTNKELSYSRIALDLHLMDYETNLLIPRKQTSIAVNVWQIAKERNFEFTVQNSGVGIDGHRNVTQGKHDAVRALTELSVLQLLGKYYEIPYWRCLEGAQEDPEVVDMIKKRYQGVSNKEKITRIQSLLKRHGYDVSITGVIDTKTQKAIKSFIDKNSQIKKGDKAAALYTQLYITMPLSPSRAKQAVKKKKSKVTPQPIKPAPSSLNMQTAFIYTPTGSKKKSILKKGATLRSGENYKVIIIPEEDCYLYLFQLDSSGNLFTLFPLAPYKDESADSPNPLTKENIYMLPGKKSTFFLDDNVGNEKIYLLASREADKAIERFQRLMVINEHPKARKKISQAMLTYLQSKTAVKTVSKGEAIAIDGEEINAPYNRIELTKLTGLSKDKVYTLEFRHE